ncbi:MAG: lysozyme [Parvibaculaceae bacterium]
MSRLAQGGALVGLLIAVVGAFESVRQTAYSDPAGIPTVCYGHTEGVRPGDRHTLDECRVMLRRDLEVYARGIERCVTVPLPDRRYVALVSFAFNVGVRAACRSSVIRLINEGRTREGCDRLLLYDKAAGITFPGLARRRREERELCLSELPA